MIFIALVQLFSTTNLGMKRIMLRGVIADKLNIIRIFLQIS